MIEIKDIQGNVILSTEINNGAKRKFQLMTEDSVTLPFSLSEPLDFCVGTNVEIDGMKFEAVTQQKPTYNNSTGGYDYQVRLDAYYWKWKNKIFKFTPEVGGQEASWSLTASLDVQLDVFLRNLKALGYTYGEAEFEFAIDGTVENKAVGMTYNNTNMIDALSAMAESWECEWWVTDNIINFGRCEYGTAVDFEIHKNVVEMSRSESKNGYATRLYVFGSTRNLPTNYRPTNESLVVSGVVQKRLMLPEGIPYIDAYEGMSKEEAIEQVVVLDDIYPRTDGNISEVTTYTDSVENEDGTTSGETFYRFKDDGLTFSSDYILEGELKVKFESGLLNGMEFGLAFNPNGVSEKLDDGSWNPEAQLFEVVINEDYGRKLPDDVLHPQVGDKYILIGWDSTKIADLGLVSKAEDELYQKGLEISSKRKIDPNTYNCRMFSDYMYGLDGEGNQDPQYSKHFEVGDRVNLINPAYFKDGRQSRIIGYEYNLDIPYDSPTYVVGETASYSRLGALEDKLDAITYGGQTYTGGSGSGVYVIGTNDTTKPTNRNVYSALRSDKSFLNKTKDDRSIGIIASDKGVEIGEFNEGTLGSGACIFERDGSTYGEMDFLKVRKKATFTNITVQELKHVGGEIVLSPAAMICSKVEEVENGYKCYFNQEDSDGRKVYNEFVVHDQARCQTFNLAENTYYWRLVIEVGEDYIVLSKTDCDTSSDIPKAGDNISQLGNRTNMERQAAIVLSAYGSDAPSYKQYNGIEWFTLVGKQVTKLSPYGNELTGILNIEAGSTGAANLKDLNIGAINLLLNSGFTGDYRAEDLSGDYQLKNGSELFSKSLKHWTGKATVNDDGTAVSGKSVYIGSLSQSVQLIQGEVYVVSFRAQGSFVKVMLGGDSSEQILTSESERYSMKFISDGICTFSISGDATICDLQLERGIMATDWKPNPNDNDKALAEFQAVKYLQDAIVEGDTTILGGLILSSIIKLGNYKDGVMQKVNAGVSGIYNDDDDVAFWGGGTFEQAIRTVMKFKENPNYTPTDAEWSGLANFVVSHGGDIFLKGTVYADNGYFRGSVIIDGGKTLLSKDGSGQLAGGVVAWNKYGVMYRKAHDNIKWVSIYEFESTKQIQLEKGTYLDLTYILSDETFALPDAAYDGTILSLRWEQISRSSSCAILSGNFKIRQSSDDGVSYQSASKLTLDVENKEIQLVYSSEDSAWIYRDKGATIDDDLITVGAVVESETEVVADKVTSNSFVVGDSTGITKTILVYENGGRSYFTFTGGILTSYSYEPNEE